MIAFLEKIILDESGNVRPQYKGTTAADYSCPIQNADHATEATAQLTQPDNIADEPPGYLQQDNSAKDHHPSTQEQAPSTFNALKRKLMHAHAEDWLLDIEDINISQCLPDEPVLSKVADFFCISFHHWIPYIHKQRLQTRVREGVRGAGFDLVLHALVAVALRHMDPNVIFLDQDEIQQQTRLSRSIVETQSVRCVSVGSLQALIFIVFDHVSH